eukprot:798365-Alexandrium_andersonii.AAC.1
MCIRDSSAAVAPGGPQPEEATTSIRNPSAEDTSRAINVPVPDAPPELAARRSCRCADRRR